MEAIDLFGTNSLSTQSSDLSQDDFVKSILPKLQAILKSRFPNNPTRQRIRVFKDRINFAAPCCGDSAHSDFKKRGNIILTGAFRNTYKCHNCGAHMSLNKFFQTYGQELSLDDITYISNNKATYSFNNGIDSSINYLYDVSAIEDLAIDREQFKTALGLENTDTANEGHFYLINRKQYKFEHFLYSVKFKKLFVLNLTPDGKIFGMQVRSLDKFHKGPKYKTYSLSKIYSEIFKINKEIPDDINSMSMIFNILRINYELPVTVVEGPMDSFLIKNSIALCGAGKHMSFPFYTRYMFDSDKTGLKHSIEYINEGYEVFMWDKYRREIGAPDKEKWDMNDILLWADKNNVKLPQLDNYFTADELDVILL